MSSFNETMAKYGFARLAPPPPEKLIPGVVDRIAELERELEIEDKPEADHDAE